MASSLIAAGIISRDHVSIFLKAVLRSSASCCFSAWLSGRNMLRNTRIVALSSLSFRRPPRVLSPENNNKILLKGSVSS